MIRIPHNQRIFIYQIVVLFGVSINLGGPITAN